MYQSMNRFLLGVGVGLLIASCVCILWYCFLPGGDERTGDDFEKPEDKDPILSTSLKPVPVDASPRPTEQASETEPAKQETGAEPGEAKVRAYETLGDILAQNVDPPPGLGELAGLCWIAIRDPVAGLVQLRAGGPVPTGRVFWNLAHLNWHSFPQTDDSAIGEGYSRFLSLMVGEDLAPHDYEGLAQVLKHYSFVAQEEEQAIFRAYGMDAFRKTDYERSAVRLAKTEVLDVFGVLYDDFETDVLACFPEGDHSIIRSFLSFFYE